MCIIDPGRRWWCHSQVDGSNVAMGIALIESFTILCTGGSGRQGGYLSGAVVEVVVVNNWRIVRLLSLAVTGVLAIPAR